MAQSVLSQHRKRWWFVKGIAQYDQPEGVFVLLSFFPAFLWDQTLAKSIQFFVLGFIFIATSAVIFGLITLAERFTRMRDWLVTHPQTFKEFRREYLPCLTVYFVVLMDRILYL